MLVAISPVALKTTTVTKHTKALYMAGTLQGKFFTALLSHKLLERDMIRQISVRM